MLVLLFITFSLLPIYVTYVHTFSYCTHKSQTKLVSVAESISSKLSYFTELESVGGRLASSALSVTSDSFTSTLTRLDNCIAFIQHNVRPITSLNRISLMM